jgi:hypothetical protein
MKLDRSYLTRIFTSLRKCKSPGEMKDLFVPKADRLDLEDLKNRAEALARSSDHQKATRLCYSGIILALEANDDNYDVLVLAAYWYSFSAGPDVLAETIARTVPIFMYQHDQGRALNLGGQVAKVTQFCKDAEHNKNSDLLSIGYLALGALLIFRPMTQSRERIESARELEQSLGLSGMEDWVKRNYR